MKTLTLTVVLAFAFAGSAQAHSFHFHPSLAKRSLTARAAGQRQIVRHDRSVLHSTAWLARTDGKEPLTESSARLLAMRNFHAAELRWTLRELGVTEARLRAQRRAAARAETAIPHRSGWLCIHGFEGSWRDAGDPFWGGLQMDRGFMGTYGSDFIRRYGGFANVWPVWAQMKAAERAYSGYHGYGPRGYGPWPNTARYCGLL